MGKGRYPAMHDLAVVVFRLAHIIRRIERIIAHLVSAHPDIPTIAGIVRTWPHILGMARDQTLEIRLTAEVKAAIRAAAERNNRTVSDWARLTPLAAAQAKAAPK
jgi:hypothetical protein